MKNKLIHGFLAAVIFLTSAGAFVSCTDSDEDRMQELQQQLLRDTLFVHKVLGEQIDSLEAIKKRMAALEAACRANCQNIQNQLANYVTISQLDQAKLEIYNKFDNYYVKNEVIQIINSSIAAADVYTKSQVENLIKNKLASYYTQAEIDYLLSKLADADDVFTKDDILNLLTDQKDYIDSQIQDFVKKEDVATVVLTQIQDANSDITKAIESQIVNEIRNGEFGTNGQNMTIDQIADAVSALEQAVSKAQADATEALTWVNNNKDAFEALKNDVANIKENYVTKDVFNALQDVVNDLASSQAVMQSKLANVEATANAAIAQANANSTAISTLQQRTDSIISVISQKNPDLNIRIDSLAREGAKLADKVKADSILADQLVKDLANLMNKADSVITLRIDSIVNALGNQNIKFEEIETAYQAADQALQDQINDLNTKVSELTERVEAVENALSDIVSTFKNAFAKLITSIVIQGTTNPILGELAMPLDVQSNILAAYYGYAKIGMTFPSRNSLAFSDADTDYPRFTAKDLEMLGDFETIDLVKDQKLIIEKEDNAGTLYLTVNPNTVDFEGTEFTLVNSLDEEAGIKLGELQHSSHKLDFGFNYTRAAANNAFYEAPASLVFPSEATPKIDVSEVKDAASAVKKLLTRSDSNHDKVNAKNLATSVLKAVGSFSLDRYGVKATWSDSLGEHSTYSAYNIAAVAWRGLPYSFAKDFSPSHVPGISRVENIIGRVINGIKVRLPNKTIDLTEFTVPNITLKSLDDEMIAQFEITLSMDTTVLKDFGDGPYVITVPAQDVKDESGNVIGTYPGTSITITELKQQNITFTRTVDLKDAVKDLYDEMQEPIADVNNLIDSINDYVKDVKKYLELVNKLQTVPDKLDKIKDKIDTYLEKFNDIAVRFMTPNKYLQPVLLCRTGNGVARMGGSKYLPTIASSNRLNVVPTSYTAELLAPAYKKFLGVTNVYDSNDVRLNAQETGGIYRMALEHANQGEFKKVIDGNIHQVEFAADPRYNGKGLVYEILYICLDYNGKMAAKKYYVKVK